MVQKFTDGDEPTQTEFRRLMRSIPATYTVYKSGSTYYADTNIIGGTDYSGTTAATVIEDAWTAMSQGGRIHVVGDIDLGSVSVDLSLTKYVKDLILTGEGETGTTFTYTGTGPTINITTGDGVVGYYNVGLSDFYVDGSTKTAGRYGINIDKVGRRAVLSGIKVYNMDIGFNIGADPNDTNQVYLYDCGAITVNTGFKTSPAATNEIAFYNCQARDSATYCFHINGGTSILFFGGLSSPSDGCGIYAYETENLAAYGHRFEGTAAYDYDVYLTGASSSYKVDNALFAGCYFNANTFAPHAIQVKYANQLTLENCRSKGHTNAFLYLEDQAHSITIINPQFDETYLLDGAALTQALSRMAGIVIDPRRMGIIAYNDSGITLTEGDVVIPKGAGTWDDTGVANDDVPAAVMYGQATSKPIVLCVKGVTPVNCDQAMTLDDTVCTQNVSKQATVNNAQTDPKKILGYIVAATAGAGLAYTKIL